MVNEVFLNFQNTELKQQSFIALMLQLYQPFVTLVDPEKYSVTEKKISGKPDSKFLLMVDWHSFPIYFIVFFRLVQEIQFCRCRGTPRTE